MHTRNTNNIGQLLTTKRTLRDRLATKRVWIVVAVVLVALIVFGAVLFAESSRHHNPDATSGSGKTPPNSPTQK